MRRYKIEFKAIIFDLDGTLLDTLEDLAGAMNKALAELGFAEYPAKCYRYFVGDGVETEARRALPKEDQDDETVARCVAITKAEYGKCWAEKTACYDGVPELLSGLEDRDIPKAILSNKPDEFVQVMVDKLLAKWSFEIVVGLSDSVRKKPDPQSALQIAADLKIAPEKIVYLGDTDTDMQTAGSAGMYAAGALWGFRGAEELRANGANLLVAKPVDILGLFNSKLNGNAD